MTGIAGLLEEALGALAQGGGAGFQQTHATPLAGQISGHDQSDSAGTDDDDVTLRFGLFFGLGGRAR